MHIINAEEQHIPAIRRIYAHHVLHGTGSFETAPPEHAGNACPGEKRSVTWISLVYRPAGGRKSLTRSCLNMGPVSGIPPDDSGCGDCANVASVALHLRSGFTEIGTLKDIGFKHGRWLDTVLLQCQLGKGSCTLPDSPVPGR